jgi:hypothetical protein
VNGTGCNNNGSGVNYGGTLSGAGSFLGGLETGGAKGGVQAASGLARAGGALSGNSSLSTAGSLGGNVLGIYNGLERGGPAGYAGAAISGVSAANNADTLATGAGFLSGGAAAGLGAAGDVLGIYNGIKQGGAMGYGGAAVDAAQLYGAASSADVAAGGAGFAGAGAGSALAGLAAPGGIFLAAAIGMGDVFAHQGSSSEDIAGNLNRGAAYYNTLAAGTANGTTALPYGINGRSPAAGTQKIFGLASQQPMTASQLSGIYSKAASGDTEAAKYVLANNITSGYG